LAPLNHFKLYLPWWARILGKVILARLPFSYSFWSRLALFQHGQMDHPAYALKTFKRHWDRVSLGTNENVIALEFGPGDSAFSAVIARTFGVSKYYLVDNDNFAHRDPCSYKNMAQYLKKIGFSPPAIGHLNSFEEILEACCASYHTSGLTSLRDIPDQSIDFIWSQAVLEHIKREEFSDIMEEFRRILHPNGVCSHRIDLKDHLGGGLNNLRFSSVTWESDLFKNSGFYTNRFRYSEMVDHFKRAGFKIEIVEIERWKTLPTSKSTFSIEFQQFSEEELCVSGFDVVLTPI